MSDVKKSYTTLLIESLEENIKDIDNKIIEHIKKFSKDYAEKMKKQKDIIKFGKYKGRKIKDIVSWDPKYCEFLLKQSYVSSDVKDEINKYLNKNE